VVRTPYLPAEPIGPDALAAELYAGTDPVASSGVRGPFEVVTVRSGVQLRLRLPFVTRDQVDLARSGDELVVTVGSHRRLLTLPAGLARLKVTGARVDDDGVLRVSFKDPSATVTEERVG
jgi:arsenite-transporting ATPase